MSRLGRAAVDPGGVGRSPSGGRIDLIADPPHCRTRTGMTATADGAGPRLNDPAELDRFLAEYAPTGMTAER